jgi:hypothetical protein
MRDLRNYVPNPRQVFKGKLSHGANDRGILLFTLASEEEDNKVPA